MKIGIIGASGNAGSLIMKEALDRGHEVTALVRNANKISNAGVEILEKNIYDLTSADLTSFDVVVNAFGAPLGEEEPHVTAGHSLIEALRGHMETKLFVVGGAGSLFVDDDMTTQVSDTADFPEIFVPTASGQARNFAELKATEDLRWTFLSPSAEFDAQGGRTGTYTAGKDHLLVNSEGNSYISYADYAIAVLDELENPQHENARFTVVAEKA